MSKRSEKKPIVKRVIDVVFTVIVVLTVIIIALSLYSKKTGREFFSYKIMWVTTQSMENTIPRQSYILTKKADVKEIKTGDVITFYADLGTFKESGEFVSSDKDGIKELNTHRVIEIIGDNESFITKGDNNLVKDANPVQASDVVAVYVRNLTLLTFFGRLYASPIGLILTLIVIMAVMFASSYFTKKQKDDGKTAEELETEKKAEIERLVLKEIERLEMIDKQKKDNE